MILGGTKSTFGEQNQSLRHTAPAFGFGTSGRTDKVYSESTESLNLGKNSPGAQFTSSSFGPQASSKNGNAPTYHLGARNASDYLLTKAPHPGPGTYETTEAIGKQVMSQKPTAANSKFGTGNRFSVTASGKVDLTPGAGDVRPSSGWMGDAPAYSTYGKGKRYETGKGLPGWTPTRMLTPGPGNYELQGSLGNQTMSKKATSPNFKMGTSERKAFVKQYVSPAHERVLLGQHSPGAGTYQQPSGLGMQTLSKRQSSQNMKFGSGDRFSQTKPINEDRVRMNRVPGPGTYVV